MELPARSSTANFNPFVTRLYCCKFDVSICKRLWCCCQWTAICSYKWQTVLHWTILYTRQNTTPIIRLLLIQGGASFPYSVQTRPTCSSKYTTTLPNCISCFGNECAQTFINSCGTSRLVSRRVTSASRSSAKANVLQSHFCCISAGSSFKVLEMSSQVLCQSIHIWCRSVWCRNKSHKTEHQQHNGIWGCRSVKGTDLRHQPRDCCVFWWI